MPESEETADPRFPAVISIRTEGWPEIELVVGQGSLGIQGPFGKLSLPYKQLTKVTEDSGEGLSIDVGRVKLALRLRSNAERTVFRFLIDARMADARRRPRA